MRVTLVVAAAVCAVILGGCGGGGDGDSSPTSGPGGTSAATPLFPDAFKGVCSGAGVDDATAYDAKAGKHKALLFQTYQDDLQDQSHRLPPAWTEQFSPTGNALTAIDLVVCAERTADQVVKTCDGYEDDGKATGNKVRWHTATYDVRLRDAKTGKQLEQREIEATSETCPLIASFDGKNDTIDMYDTLDDAVFTKLLKPFMGA